MRCYFIRKGHIADVEVLNGESDNAVIEQARALFESSKRGCEAFEIWECERFVYCYPERPLGHVNTTGRAETGPSYRFYLLDDDGVSTLGSFEFAADSEQAAYEIAERAFDACSDRAKEFELRHDAKRIGPAVLAPMTSCEQVVVSRRAQVVALEERMRDSRWAVSSSERLLARLKDVKARFVSRTMEMRGAKPASK